MPISGKTAKGFPHSLFALQRASCTAFSAFLGVPFLFSGGSFGIPSLTLRVPCGFLWNPSPPFSCFLRVPFTVCYFVTRYFHVHLGFLSNPIGKVIGVPSYTHSHFSLIRYFHALHGKAQLFPPRSGERRSYFHRGFLPFYSFFL